MRQGSHQKFLKLALAGVWLAAAAHAQDARGLPQRLGDTGLYVAGSLSESEFRRTAVFAAVPLVVGWRRQASLDLAAAGNQHRRLHT